jgi:hypothetical protein
MHHALLYFWEIQVRNRRFLAETEKVVLQAQLAQETIEVPA